MDKNIYDKAYAILKELYGEGATFKDGQYEAIEATLTNRRTLVIQKTGWGKSLVYFICARMVKGLTIVISPLLVLMDNQKEYAEKLHLRCEILNGKVDKDSLLQRVRNGECDVLLTTPEQIAKPGTRDILAEVEIGMFVVDECHCISDWGHDFRLEYGMLNRVIRDLPQNVPVLGTTATANDRVVEDLKKQFGENVFVSRGPLERKSLYIEILKIPTKAERYAWIKKNLAKLPGTGIIYCATKSDCTRLSEFLNESGYNVRPYFSEKKWEEPDEKTGISQNQETEMLLKENKIKAIIATIKLGMGYDKKDIGFVIHFQRPSSIVSYYQMIGRAGREENSKAYCYLMTGNEDQEIQEYFIENAFPEKEQEECVIKALEGSPDGLTIYGLQKASNISSKALNKCIMFLINQGIIYKDYKDDRVHYFRSAKQYSFQGDHYEAVRQAKRKELQELNDYSDTKECLSKFVIRSLNDNTAKNCGRCRNCLGHAILAGIEAPDAGEILAIQEKLNSIHIPIKPKESWPQKDNQFDVNSKIKPFPNATGMALCKYGDAGYGEMVKYDKYKANCFRDELVEASGKALINEDLGNKGYSVVTNIPSARNTKVKDFAEKLAAKLGFKYMELLDVTGANAQQKEMQNRYYQFRNAAAKIKLKDGVEIPQCGIILVDDMVDSGWTLTVAGALLAKAGAKSVYPYCLANSSMSEDE